MLRLAPCLLLLFALLSGCAAPESCALVPLAQMGIDIEHNLMFVRAEIGHQPVRLVVDTGAQRTVLTEAAVARLRLPHDTSHPTSSYGIGGMSTNWDVFIPNIVLGRTRFPVDRLAVGDFSLGGDGGPAADGLLGADILLAFDMDIDEPAHRLTLYRVRRCANAVPPWPEPAIRIQGVTAKVDRLLVPFELDGTAGLAILDTGAQATTIGMAMARRLGLTTASLQGDRQIEMHGAAPNPMRAHVHRFRELQVGDAVIRAPALAVVHGPAGMGDALLGGDFLSGRRVWLSLATRQLFISAPGLPMLAVRR